MNIEPHQLNPSVPQKTEGFQLLRPEAPKADSWLARTVTFLLYASPFGAGAVRAIAPTQVVSQVALLLLVPLSVYLDKTWSKQREDESKRRRTIQEGFFRSYTQSLQLAIEATQTTDALIGDEIRKPQKSVLKLICEIIESYLGKPDNLQINANVMRFEAVGKWSQNGRFSDVLFAPRDRDLESFRGVLHLSVWAKTPTDDAEICLPVAARDDILLFGAPKAFVLGAKQYVADTRNSETLQDLVARQDDDVRLAISSYLSRKSEVFVSFICVPLRFGEEIVGVLNVQSNQKEVLGQDEIHWPYMESCLLPLCSLLGILIAQENERESAT